MNRILMTQVTKGVTTLDLAESISLPHDLYSTFKDSNVKDESSDQTKILFRNSDNQDLPQRHQAHNYKVDQVKITTSKNDDIWEIDSF
ncbi:hypothetical protein Tco_1487742 [Tanacetum coccineum]